MNQTLEQYRSSLHGLIPDYRSRFSEKVIDTLSQYVPENQQTKVVEAIRFHRQGMREAVDADENRDRYELTYLERLTRHMERKKAYEENTLVTP